MRSKTTEADVERMLDYVVGESYGSYYYDGIRNSHNVKVMEKYLKLMTGVKGSDFLERKRIWSEMDDAIRSLTIEEQVEDVNTYEWVIETLIESKAIRLAKEGEQTDGLSIVLPKRLRYLRRR